MRFCGSRGDPAAKLKSSGEPMSMIVRPDVDLFTESWSANGDS